MMTREEYTEKLKAQLDQWNAEVSKWEAKTRDAQAGMKADYEKQLETFRRQRDEAIEQMRKMQNAAGDAWMNMIRASDDAWARAREAFEKASSQFHKK